MLANLLIALREGLEACLVVSILVAYLVKTDRRHEIRYIWIGVVSALVLVVAVFTAVTIAFDQLSFTWQEGVGGTLSIVAAILVTWMIFWMRRTARGLKRDLEGQVESALKLGPGALVLVAFLTVGREGLETAAFIWSTISASTDSSPFVGASIGLVVAVVLGYLIYRGALTINLGTFFQYTGALLIVVAAGVLAYGVYDLQEAGFLPGIANTAFDISSWYDQTSWYGSLLKGTVGFQANPSWLQSVVWIVYIVPVLYLYLRPRRQTPAPGAPATRASTQGA